MLCHHIARLGIVFALSVTTSTVVAADSVSSVSSKAGVQITRLEDRLRVEVNGELFTEYFFKDVPRPYCYPLIGPGKVAMTRDWPMKDSPGEEQHHPHHRSLWFAHGSMNGQDFGRRR